MPIANENRSTSELLKDARYHRAALAAEPEARALVPALEAREGVLRERHAATQAAEDARLVAHAELGRSDRRLDTLTRTVELAVFSSAKKDRKAPLYRASFPDGLTAFVATRGQEQALSVRSLVNVLRERAPEIADLHGEALVALADASEAAERAYLEAEKRAVDAFVLERVARVELLRQMRVNRAALGTLYPDDAREVRSFYRPGAKTSRPDDAEESSVV